MQTQCRLRPSPFRQAATGKQRRSRFRRLVEEALEPRLLLAANGGDTRHLRLAVTATEEYTAFFGTRQAAQDAIETTVAAVNKVFNRELNLQLDLIDNLDIIFGPGNSPDPFPTGGPGFVENQTLLDTVIGSSGYDMGIIFGGLSIGLASLGSAGIDGEKAKGYTGFTAEEGGPAGGNAIDNALHEMGHQLAATHSFNGTLGTCGDPGQFAAATALEPGGGSTLSAYTNICAGDNIQKSSDFYYHAGSLDQIVAHLESLDAAGVGTKDVGVNSIPQVDAGEDFTIPARTPFHIDVTGSDAEDLSGDSLRYNVEQMDTGPAQTLDPFPGDNGASPLFRSFPPAPADGGTFTRVFPQIDDILSGTVTKGEYLPTTTRELNFRATVRDGEGGTNGDNVTLSVVDTGSPFAVTSHASTATLTGGTSSTVTWDVAGTTGNGIDTAMVNILLSTDGGHTFPHTLASTANDGSHTFTVPNLDTAAARIKVEGAGNIFFDISDADFTITSDAGAAGVAVTNSVFVGEGGTFSELNDTYTLALNTVPTSSVEITVAAGEGVEVSTDGASFAPTVVFSRTDTSSQTITVRAVEDGKSEGAQQIPISHSITSSSDSAYPPGLVIDQVVAGVADNEQAPLIAVDAQVMGLSIPQNWTEIDDDPSLFFSATFDDLVREDGVTTGVSLTLDPTDTGSFIHTDLQVTPLTAPIHAPSLVDVGGAVHYVNTAAGAFTVDAIWSGLDPGTEYNVYAFAMEGFAVNSSSEPLTISQTVTITGDGVNDPAPFVQDSTARTRLLLVNDQVGDDTQTLESFAKTATANASGEITVSFFRDDGFDSNRIVISGLAIQPVTDVVLLPLPDFNKQFVPSSIQAGGTSTLIFSIDNTATTISASFLEFTDNLPSGVVVATPPNASTTCVGGTLTATAGSSLISYSDGTAPGLSTCTLQVDVTSSTEGTYLNTSSALSSGLGFSGDASATLTVTAATQTLDFGDAPTAAQSGFVSDYPTVLPDGARHTTSALRLGSTVDSEDNGQPAADADGDGGDEDGVQIVTSAVTVPASGTTASFLITASAPGKLDAWIDFGRDGDWLGAGEQVATGVDLVAGPNIVSYSVPAGAGSGDTFARFRLSSAGGLSPTGAADDGEVEDHRLALSDGASAVPVLFDLLVGVVELAADGSDVVLSQNGSELFRAPASAVASSAFQGTGGDDEVRLGDFSSAISGSISLIYDGQAGRDSLRLIATNQSLDLTDTTQNQISNIEEIDIVGASPNTLTLDGASVSAVTDAANTLVVVHDEDDDVDYSGDGWEVQAPEFIDGEQHHVLTNGAARVETINTRPFRNPFIATDVNFSGATSSLDALQIINFLGRNESTSVSLPAPTSADELPERYYDVNGSTTATALDALNVINFLGRQSVGGGELIVAPALLPTTTHVRSAASTQHPGLDTRLDIRLLDAVLAEFALREVLPAAGRNTSRPMAVLPQSSQPFGILPLPSQPLAAPTLLRDEDTVQTFNLALQSLLSDLGLV